jgi:ABC-2 type transport system permease protein
MSGLTDRLRAPRLPRIRRAGPARPLDVDGRPSPRERVIGLGTIFAKSLRDSRRGILLGGLGVGLIVFITGTQVAAEFGTVVARAAMAALPQQLPPIFRGLLGEPINIEKLGGFLSWRTLNFMPILLGAWSIATLSGTLAAEARRGSLDLLATTPRSRLSIAIQKGSAHALAVGIATLVVAVLTWATTIAFATLPGDETTLPMALAHAGWLWQMAIFPGSIAWLVAPVVGRGAAAGLGSFVMIASFVVDGYHDALPAFDAVDTISYFGLTAGHRPLAGVTDWGGVAIVLAIEVACLVGGALVFRTRDIGVNVGLGLPLPRFRLGLRGPIGRSFAERLSVSAWWGIGIGVMGFIYAANAQAFIDAFKTIPQITQLIERFMPGVDVFSTGGILQLVFFGFGTLLIAAAAGMLANGWASDETERRLEFVLSAPLARARWAFTSALGVLAGVVLLTVLVAILITIGTLAVAGDVARPILGTVVLGIYGGALVGVGIAVGGVVRPGYAAPVAAGLGGAFYLLDSLGTALRLPSWVLDLSLTKHLGQPMAGVFDPVGTAVCAALAVGGVIVGAVGMARRDLGR